MLSCAPLLDISHGPSPREQETEGLRNPYVDKFLPGRRKAKAGGTRQHERISLEFVHFPIVDMEIPTKEK